MHYTHGSLMEYIENRTGIVYKTIKETFISDICMEYKLKKL